MILMDRSFNTTLYVNRLATDDEVVYFSALAILSVSLSSLD